MFALWGWSSLPWLHRIDRPTLVVAADDDPIVPLANARLIARQLPKGRLYVVADGGHLFLVTHADQVAPVVERFLYEDDRVVPPAPDEPEGFPAQVRRAE